MADVELAALQARDLIARWLYETYGPDVIGVTQLPPFGKLEEKDRDDWEIDANDLLVRLAGGEVDE